LIELLLLFLNNLLPIFLTAGAGYIVGKILKIEPRTFSVVSYYIFNPCLVITVLLRNQLDSRDVLLIMGYTTAVVCAIGVISWLVGQALRLERRLLAAVMLTTMFMNSGNLGMPVNLFAFGDVALAYASLYFVTQFLLVNTVGVLVASMGTVSLKTALVNLLRVPTIYAVAVAVVMMQMRWQLPLPMDRAVELLGDAAVPSMLVLLGLQLKEARWTGQSLALSLSGAFRLLLAPLVAVSLSIAFGLQGVARQVGILESSMPTAVVTTVLASEYDVDPSFVSLTVFATTLLSPLTLTPLMALLGA